MVVNCLTCGIGVYSVCTQRCLSTYHISSMCSIQSKTLHHLALKSNTTPCIHRLCCGRNHRLLSDWHRGTGCLSSKFGLPTSYILFLFCFSPSCPCIVLLSGHCRCTHFLQQRQRYSGSLSNTNRAITLTRFDGNVFNCCVLRAVSAFL